MPRRYGVYREASLRPGFERTAVPEREQWKIDPGEARWRLLAWQKPDECFCGLAVPDERKDYRGHGEGGGRPASMEDKKDAPNEGRRPGSGASVTIVADGDAVIRVGYRGR